MSNPMPSESHINIALRVEEMRQYSSLIKRRVVVFLLLIFAYNILPSVGEFEVGSALAVDLAPRSEGEEQIINAYKLTNKAVVNVRTQALAMDFFGPTGQSGSGSGVIIDAAKGYVLTNYHVIANAQEIAITIGNGHSLQAEVVGLDPDNDIALLRLLGNKDELVSVELGESTNLDVGQRVLAIGNPFGLERTLSSGIISSLGRTIRAETGRLIEDIIQTDASINPGNSGGPLLDVAGRVIGLNTAIVSNTGGSVGIGFAIPVHRIKKTLPQLIKYGRVLRPKIGVIIADTEYGPVLLYVAPDSPADRAGLSGARKAIKSGAFSGYVVNLNEADFVLEVNGERVNDKAAIVDRIEKFGAESTINIRVRRGLSTNGTRLVKVKPELS